MELGALICRPKNPSCYQCPLTKNCKSFKKKDFEIIKERKKKIDRFYLLEVYKKNNKFLLIKNTKFNFLKNLQIFPMKQIPKPDNSVNALNFKISNMNMNVIIKFSNLKSFYEIAISKSISKASAKLNISQSALSRQIQDLEYDLKTPLFIRHQKGVRLTEQGENLFNTVKSD